MSFRKPRSLLWNAAAGAAAGARFLSQYGPGLADTYAKFKSAYTPAMRDRDRSFSNRVISDMKRLGPLTSSRLVQGVRGKTRSRGRIAYRKRRNIKRRGAYRAKKRYRKCRIPIWAKPANQRYFAQNGAIRDFINFNMNRVEDSKQNNQQYFMWWNYLATNVDDWLAKANNNTGIASTTAVSEILLRKVTTKVSLKNAFSHPCVIQAWYVWPKRRYSEATATITGINPAIVSGSMDTENKTTALDYNMYGHEPTDDSDFTRLFKVYKLRSVFLQPGQQHSFILQSKKCPKLYSKIDYGIGDLESFDNHYTVLPHAGPGILIRVRGTMVHNEADVTTAMNATDTNVGYSSFAVDGVIERVCHHLVPVGLMQQPKKVWGTLDYGLGTMTLANEQAFNGLVGEYPANA